MNPMALFVGGLGGWGVSIHENVMSGEGGGKGHRKISPQVKQENFFPVEKFLFYFRKPMTMQTWSNNNNKANNAEQKKYRKIF